MEVGNRLFENLPAQWVISLENTYFFHHRFIVNAILFYDNRQIEHLVTGGINTDIGISKAFRISLSYFHNRNLDILGSNSNRFMLAPKVLVGKSELNLGFFYDQIQNLEGFANQAHGYFGLLSFPIVRQLDGRILFHQDVNSLIQNSALFSLGITLKL